MPFKVVQTIEDEKKVLTVVPSTWERQGILMWPTSKSDLRLINDEKSQPKIHWLEMPCQAKREFQSAKEAHNEVRVMELADSEIDENNIPTAPKPTPRPRPRKTHSTHVLATVDMNDMADKYAAEASNQAGVGNKTKAPQAPIYGFQAPVMSSGYQDQASIYAVNMSNAEASNQAGVGNKTKAPQAPIYGFQAPVMSSGCQDQASIYAVNMSNAGASNTTNEPQAAICNFQAPVTAAYQDHTVYPIDPLVINVPAGPTLSQVHEEVKETRRQLASLQASVDMILQKILCGQNSQQKEQKRQESFIIKPAKNITDLHALENKLKNQEVFTHTVKAMSHICGTSGKGKGIDDCYKLVDNFFSRELLVDMTWTGYSKDKDTNKIALKYFTTIKDCFVEVIRLSDQDFSETECEKFFKTVIKNAKQRLNPKIMSASKSKPKKIKTAVVPQENPTEEQLEEDKENFDEPAEIAQERVRPQNNLQQPENDPENDELERVEIEGEEVSQD